MTFKNIHVKSKTVESWEFPYSTAMHASTLPNACTTFPLHERLMYSVLHNCSKLPDLGLLLGLAFWGLLGRSSSFWRGITGSSFSRVGEGNKAPSTVTKSLVLYEKMYHVCCFQFKRLRTTTYDKECAKNWG